MFNINNAYLFVVLIIVLYIAYNSFKPSIEQHTEEIITPTYETFETNNETNNETINKTNNETNNETINETNNTINTESTNNKVDSNNTTQENTGNAGSNVNGVESGHCYQPQTDLSYSTFKLDTSLINQMAEINTADEYVKVVGSMRQKYKDKLNETMDALYETQDDVEENLSKIQSNLNKYGMETLSKQYYDTIYKYGDFESVKDSIVLPKKQEIIIEQEPEVKPEFKTELETESVLDQSNNIMMNNMINPSDNI